MNKTQFQVLYRDFLARMIDLEILSSHAEGDATTLLGQFVSLLILVSFILSVAANIFANARVSPQLNLFLGWTGEHTLIATTMLVVGLFAVLSWDSTFPDRRDVMVLSPLPVRARTLFLAKVAAVASALGLTILTLHCLAGLAWPLALNKSLPARTTLKFATDRALPPVSAPELQALLDREFAAANATRTGFLDPGNGTGAAIGVVRHGVRRVFAYGAAKPNSIFEIGSISKTFTALILARMVEEGKVKLDDPIRRLLPPNLRLPPSPHEITLLDLATHRSGLPRMPDNFRPADRNNPWADYHPANLYEYFVRHGVAKPENPEFAYSNLGFGLLGQLLADRAGVSYPQLLKEQITDVLGLNDTVVVLSPQQATRFIPGHDGDHRPAHPLELDALAGAGAIRSTAGDMLTYLEAQLHPETVPELTAALRDTHQLRAEVMPGAGIGLSWLYNLPAGSRAYLHDGATAGFTSDAIFKPADDYAVVVLFNTGPGATGFAGLLSEHIRQRLAGEPAFSLDSVSIPETGGILSLLRTLAAYWITMTASGVFIFCCVLSAQGIAAQLLPRRLFLRVSSLLQMASFCLFVSVYFLQPKLAAPLTLIEAQGSGALSWSPSYWFLGLFQQLNGSPALGPLAHRAWIGLGAALATTAVAYALAYFRTLRKIVEEPDIVPAARGVRWLPSFGQSVATAIVQFTIRTLLRSRQHRIILAFYLGLGFAAAIFFMKPPSTEPELAYIAAASPWREVGIPLLASTILMLGFWIVGNRVVFSLPLDLKANWVFRVTPVPTGLPCLRARRRALWVVALLPFWTLCGALMLAIWPWRPALQHLAVLVLLGATVGELCLGGTVKIPFTCSWLPGKSHFHITLWIAMLLVIVIVTNGAVWELGALGNTRSYWAMIGILSAVAIAVYVKSWITSSADEQVVKFEEVPSWHLLTLDLPRDGGLQQ